MSPRTEQQNEEIRRQTRQLIIDSAFKLFASHGYDQTRMATIAKKAEVSKGLIYHYFSSKEELLETIFEQLVQIGDETLSFPAHFTPSEKIQQLLTRIFEYIEQDIEQARLMLSMLLQPDTISHLKQNIDEVRERQVAQFKTIMQELGFENPEVEAFKLGALMDGILIGVATLGDEYPLEEMKQKVMEEYVSN